jgi:hypothetical protein
MDGNGDAGRIDQPASHRPAPKSETRDRARVFRGVADRNVIATISIGGVWRSWLTHVLWEHEIVGSNPTTPTTTAARSLPSRRLDERIDDVSPTE